MGLILLEGVLKWEQGAEPPWPPHFNHCQGLSAQPRGQIKIKAKAVFPQGQAKAKATAGPGQ